MDILIVALLIAVVIIDILILLKTLSKKNTTYLDKKEKEEIIGAFSSNVSIISAALQNSADRLQVPVYNLLRHAGGL